MTSAAAATAPTSDLLLPGMEQIVGGDVTVEGVVKRLRAGKGDFRVFDVEVDKRGRLAIEPWVGEGPPVAVGQRVRGTGRYETHREYGEQFRANVVVTLVPTTSKATAEYLGSGVIEGIGPVYAEAMVAYFEARGERVLDVLDFHPERVMEVPGIGTDRAEAIIRGWKLSQATARMMIFLQGHGAKPSLATKIVRYYLGKGLDPLAVIQADPYRLALDVYDVGFKTADIIARSIGVGVDSPARAQAGALHVLGDMGKNGHTFMDLDELTGRTSTLIERPGSGPRREIRAAIEEMGAGKLLVIEPYDGEAEQTLFGPERQRRAAVFAPEVFTAEWAVAGRIAAIQCGLGRKRGDATARLLDAAETAMGAFEESQHMVLAPEQRAAICAPAQHGFVVITGGPGTGKSTIMRAVLAMFDAVQFKVRLCSPTGRAAKRLGEATGSQGASTIHRLLGMQPGRPPEHDAEEPIDCDVLIADEASMVDLRLAEALLEAVADGTRVIFVGDRDQLPSVGPGAVLRDIIASELVHVVRLERVYRQGAGSQIGLAAQAIIHGKMPESSTDPAGEFFLIERSTPGAAEETIEELVMDRIPKAFGIASDKIAVMVPQHKGAGGTLALNTRLQEALNPRGKELARGGKRFRVGDPVLQLKNDYEREIFNGDKGVIVAVHKGAGEIEVSFEGRVLRLDDEAMDKITLAYASTVHKCVHPDTLVETPHGLLKIRDILGSGSIATPNGPRQYHSKVSNPPRPMLEVVTTDGYRVTVTPDHGLDVWDGSAYVRVEAQDVKPGQYVRLKMGATIDPVEPAVLPAAPEADVRAKLYAFPTVVTEDVAEFFGLMVADGTVYKRGFRLVKCHADVIERFRSLAVNVLGAKPMPCCILGTDGYEINATQISTWLTRIGGMSPNEKRVPDCILRSPLKVQAAFLRGLFEDGSVHLQERNGETKLDHIEWTTCFPELEVAVRLMLLRLGIIAGTTTKTSAPNMRLIEIYGENAIRFRDAIGFVADAKNERLTERVGDEVRYMLPISNAERQWAATDHRIGRASSINNALTRGVISRHAARELMKIIPDDSRFAALLRERMAFHHSRVKSITETAAPSMCVEVPDGHRFLQNGFSGWNCQGAEFAAVVIYVGVEHEHMLTRSLFYTAVTRGKQLVVVVAPRRAVAMAIRETRRDIRRTRLAERLRSYGS